MKKIYKDIKKLIYDIRELNEDNMPWDKDAEETVKILKKRI